MQNRLIWICIASITALELQRPLYGPLPIQPYVLLQLNVVIILYWVRLLELQDLPLCHEQWEPGKWLTRKMPPYKEILWDYKGDLYRNLLHYKALLFGYNTVVITPYTIAIPL